MDGDGERRILITGAAGMLGGALCRHYAGSAHVIGAYHRAEPTAPCDESYRMDVTDEFTVKRVMERSHPGLVIHCAGLINVDAAEEDYAATREVNAIGTRNVARHVPEEAVLVYISTDSVFDGARGGYVESDLPCPPNNYAKSKLEGEWFAMQEAAEHLVVRTNIFGRSDGGGPSFAEWVHDSLASGQQIRMVTDWMFSPILVESLCDAIEDMLRAGARGLYHVAGGVACSKYDFGATMAEICGLDAGLITPVFFEQLSFKARRPRDMSLDCSKAEAVLGRPLPRYDEGIRQLSESWA